MKTQTNTQLIDLLYKGFSLGEVPYKSELMNYIDTTFADGQSKKVFIDIVRDTDEIKIDDCAKLFVAIIGPELFEIASKEKNVIEMNVVLKKGITQVVGSNDARIDTLISMYVKGCSAMNIAPFYDAWLSETNKTK
jgi:hypothetical protein